MPSRSIFATVSVNGSNGKRPGAPMTKAPDGGSMSLQEPKEIQAVERPAMKAIDKSIIRPTEAQHKNIFSVENVDFYYGEKRALKSINLAIGEKKATAFI